MDVPTIGKAKGLFEIFIPGVFLLMNFVWVLYCFQPLLWKNLELNGLVQGNEILILVVITVFGYLAGVVLWLGDADLPDKSSAKLRKYWRRIFPATDEAFYGDEFPYIESLGSIAKKYLPEPAYSFYRDCWEPRVPCSKSETAAEHSRSERDPFKNKYFFNYCKALINAVDEKSALENYSNEALIMYLAAMFYALGVSICLLASVIIIQIFYWIIQKGDSTFVFYDYRMAVSSVLFSFYFVSVFILLWHFRYMRFKEVQTVFTASLINRESVETYFKENYIFYCI